MFRRSVAENATYTIPWKGPRKKKQPDKGTGIKDPGLFLPANRNSIIVFSHVPILMAYDTRAHRFQQLDHTGRHFCSERLGDGKAKKKTVICQISILLKTRFC